MTAKHSKGKRFKKNAGNDVTTKKARRCQQMGQRLEKREKVVVNLPIR